VTKIQAEAARVRAIQAVKDAQAAIGKAFGPVEKQRAKTALAVRLAELAEAKAALKQINVAQAGLAPIAPTPEPARPTIEQLATTLIESFQALLIADPTHAAIRALRAHFDAEKPTPITVLDKRVRPSEPPSLIQYMDAGRRRRSGPGANL
jgi:hypothetical protein